MVTYTFMEKVPLLTPIRTAAIRDEPAAQGQLQLPTSDEECVTPKSEEHAVKPAVVCPPAPKKPRPAKRRFKVPPEGFCIVPQDLTSVFVALPSPSKKRIRVG